MYVDGAAADAASGATFTSTDPFDLSEWARVPEAGPVDVDRAVDAARRAFRTSWWRARPRERARVLRAFAALLDGHVDHLAAVESRDNGKTITEVRAGFTGVGDHFRHAASIAEAVPGTAPTGGRPDVLALTRRVPYGVIGIQIPWNTPGVILAQSAAPALAAGNCIVVKPSEMAPCSTLEISRLAGEAGFPPGVVNVVTGFGAVVGAALCAHPGVDKLVFTGSTAAGAVVAGHAASRTAPVVMELGGKAAHLVFADADLDAAALGVVSGFTTAAGQSCMCGSRVLVERSVHDEVIDRVVDRLRALRIGDPRDPATEMGPLCGPGQAERVARYIAAGRAEGAVLRHGGGRPAGFEDHPHFVEPTVFTGATSAMTICQEEIFGPVAAVMGFDDEPEAVRIANDTRYGLSAAVWTDDLHRAHRVAEALDVGVVFVNTARNGDPAYANGGRGHSGYGRVSGLDGFHEMTQSKSIQLRLRPSPAGR
ncbi:aldehyde dehydrogenase family protein [Pseudonocardia dioxanivorans]|uniref:aldehyde dehydrogenase family protein n=1 Tax=Pseudonocardia dioxanivorans TaxID=240495 RepID=UPI000CD062F4|nr:aldehyde dehydrogenase family protein [Pseudonocardia dioxanivorans]